MKKQLTLFSLLIVAFSIAASAQQTGNLVVNGDAAKGLKNWTGPLQVVENGPQNTPCFSVTGSKMITTTDWIEVDPSKTYRLSGDFKSAGGGPNVALIGLRLFNAEKKAIDATSVSAIANSGTTLAADAGTGSTQVKVRDAASWENAMRTQRLAIAFATSPGEEYSDLPNFQTCRVTSLEKSDDGWDISLDKPLDKPYQEGTAVRAHLISGHLMYVFTFNKHLPDWTNYQGLIKPVVKNGSPSSTFWPGTKYIKIMILANWGRKENETLLFGNISLEEVKSGN